MPVEYFPLPGTPVEELDTPALVIDMDIAEANIKTLQANANRIGATVRPHVKTHKSPYWALKQIEAGAVGVCAAKLGEAEAMVEGGVRDILIANEIVGDDKIARLMSVAARAKLRVAVDSGEVVAALSRAATRTGVEVGVLVDLNVRLNRCGVEPGKPAADLALQVSDSPGLRFDGVMGYEGHIAPGPDGKGGEEMSRFLTKLEAGIESVEKAGLPVGVVSGGGTCTYKTTGAHPRVTELQCGTYIFNDGAYINEAPEFKNALYLMSRVISKAAPDRAVIDIGLKSVSVDSGLPLVVDMPGAKLERLSEEHGSLTLEGEAKSLRLNDRVKVLPMHGDTTINIHSHYFCVRKGVLESVVPIAARGMFR
jgi:D-serine deaminase-like pyridoxal phosphate-dependent protein